MGDPAHWTSIGHTTRGLLLHRKYEDDIATALAGARRVRDPWLRFRVLQGIGWGMQYRFETSGDVQRIAQDFAAVPRHERFAMLSGLDAFARLRITQLGQRPPRPGSATLAENLTRLVAWADDEWNSLPPRYRTLEHIPDEDPRAGDFELEVAAATANADPKQRFRLLQEVGGRLVAGFEADGNMERVQRDLDSVPIGIRFAVLSGLRFRASVRVREVHERLRDPSASAEEHVRAARLDQLRRTAPRNGKTFRPSICCGTGWRTPIIGRRADDEARGGERPWRSLLHLPEGAESCFVFRGRACRRRSRRRERPRQRLDPLPVLLHDRGVGGGGVPDLSGSASRSTSWCVGLPARGSLQGPRR